MVRRILSSWARENRGRRAAHPAATGALALGLMASVLAGCGGAEDKTVVFGDAEPLLADSGEGTPVFTASIRAAGPSAADGPVLVAEPLSGRITLLTDCATGCREEVIEGGLGLPVRAAPADLDGDGVTEVLVADIGELTSSDAEKGRALLAGAGEPKVLVDGRRRLVRAEPADLDGDGDADLLGCAFGSQSGEIFWAEQDDGAFTPRPIDPLAGASDAFAFDADGDGDLDVAAQISQSSEEVNLYRNQGKGVFEKDALFKSEDACHGLSSLTLADLDQDGDTDLLVTNGDDMDLECHGPYYADQHGLVWMENDGKGGFERHEILGMYGAYVVRPADLDADGDLDLVLASYSWDPEYTPPADFAPLVWLENDGRQTFTRHDIDGSPAALLAMDVTDVDGDAVPDLLVGSADPMNVLPDLRRLVVLHGEQVPR